jgi:superfamily I DNA/RNA helicase
MTIEDYQIEESELLLLPNGSHFDKERIDFIKSLSSLDLMAVPGSGKTTALQAKLYCLAKQMPLDNGQGVLVLSHTNAAVDEIKHKLKTSVPQLFEYPNAVCTVQEFVDRFLAIPYYESCNKRSIDSIDAERYYNNVLSYFKRHYPHERVLIYYLNRYPNKYKELRLSIDNQGNVYLSNDMSGNAFSIKTPGTWVKNNTAETDIEKLTSIIFSMKKDLLKEGVLHYDDCYFLANRYIQNCPTIIDCLRYRFPFVFVDETQDLQKHQLDLIDEIFNHESVCLQRIGDPNQAIYSRVSADCVWKPRNVKTLNNSLRLSKEIAEVVDFFTLERGKNEEDKPVFIVKSDRQTTIKPHLVLYTESTAQFLKKTFADLITNYNLQNAAESKKYGFHILGWNAEAKAEGYSKYHLEDVFSDYRKENKEITDSAVLNDYLKLAQQTNDPKKAKKYLEESICFALREAQIQHDFGDYQRYYSPRTLFSFLESLNKEKEYLLVLYETLNHLKENQPQEAHDIITTYVNNALFPIWNIEENEKTKAYMNSPSTIPEVIEQVEDDSDINIEIGTVHSAKGQTHCATMYVETWYESHYETGHLKAKQNLPNPLFKQTHNYSGVYVKEAMKMIYVGFSRPTHLLCLASQKEGWSEEELQKMNECGWEIVDISTMQHPK